MVAAAGVCAAACVNSSPPRRVQPTRVEATVIDRPERGGSTMGPIAWSLEHGSDAASAPQSPQSQEPKETNEQREARIRLQFGSNVLIAPDGTVTKQYFLAGELAQTFLKLIADITPEAPPQYDAKRTPPHVPPPGTKVGGAANRSILGRMLRDHEVEVTFVPDFEVLSGVRIVDPPVPALGVAITGEPPDNSKYVTAPSVGLALISGKPSALAAFEATMDLFYTSIPQIEISVQVVEYQTADALSFGVSQVNPTTPIIANLSSGALVRSYSSVFPLRAPTVGSSPVTDISRFTLGGIHESWELNAVLEALEANNLADITNTPKLVVRNGGVASISTLTQFPFPKAKISQLGTEVATDIEFKPVGVKMNIVPVIAGTDSVILQVYADVSAITQFAATEPVNTPIVSQRTAVTTVYLRDNFTLVIGGLQAKTLFESETKVPILGDIPLLGFLFRSTSRQRSTTNVEFHITPHIVKDRGTPTPSTL